MKLRRKITGSQPERVSNGGPIWLNGKQVLNVSFFNILGLIRVSGENNLNKLMNIG